MRTASFLFAMSLGITLTFGCSKAPSTDQPAVGSSPNMRMTHLVSLQLGEQPGAFQVEDVTGPAAGESLCYRCKYGSRPTVVIFAREVNPSVANLVQQIDQKVSENEEKKLAAFMVALNEDPEEIKPQLIDVQTSHHIRHIPLTVFNDLHGPAGYGLSPEATVQVMMWNREGIRVNEILDGEISDDQIAKVVHQTESILK
ncbi:hypothetical protein [Blastopirellula marina]|uniref:Thioredoxin domain-containing protein n=1 Tax=Blastopirellula marina TaxID=124 RepID=A0A2S8GN99_9BACT|nr:hypothetical protein [Blastopirellula marina]PQO45504.1 hypothetical protein C5Y93_13735 [Blastopirellula marina]